MAASKLRRLASNLTNRDYLSAVFFWIVRRLTGVQVHRVMTLELRGRVPGAEVADGSDLRFLVLRDPGDLEGLRSDIVEQLDEQCGSSCRALVSRGDWVYFVTDGDGRVACQMNVRHGSFEVDSPTDLAIRVGPQCSFWGHLYTRPDYRGRGVAGAILRYAADDSARAGLIRCYSHIRSTNHMSMRAVRKDGWVPAALMLTSASGRLLGAPGCKRIGLEVTPINRA